MKKKKKKKRNGKKREKEDEENECKERKTKEKEQVRRSNQWHESQGSYRDMRLGRRKRTGENKELGFYLTYLFKDIRHGLAKLWRRKLVYFLFKPNIFDSKLFSASPRSRFNLKGVF